ncbi:MULTISPECIES: hypothetical protein [Ralstonia]|uniref:Transmembrane protein n=2 Tax=Ralstonia TaxID=48736 RepID=A0AAD2F2D2_9RALS|nr:MULTISPECIES: hypothetical protein [Ralstonia]NMV39938.1 hypothetical protein [Ralstonia insidiosa]CAJ0807614.1 hypothetical protein R77560_04600 [Ralstonia sp. LMG 18095]
MSTWAKSHDGKGIQTTVFLTDLFGPVAGIMCVVIFLKGGMSAELCFAAAFAVCLGIAGFGRWAFLRAEKERQRIEAMQKQLADMDRLNAECKVRAETAERAAHELVEEARYTLGAAAEVLAEKNQATGATLADIARVLPYVLSGRRHWNDQPCDGNATRVKAEAQAIARSHGFELPCDPIEAVKALLELSSMLLVPSYSLPIEGLKVLYPLEENKR